MQPSKANKLFRALGGDAKVYEGLQSGKVVEHTGFGDPAGMTEHDAPGEYIAIRTYDKPSIMERIKHESRSPEEKQARILGALAEAGFDGDQSAPQLELMQDPDNGPLSHYDDETGKIITQLNFRDHNPQR